MHADALADGEPWLDECPTVVKSPVVIAIPCGTLILDNNMMKPTEVNLDLTSTRCSSVTLMR